MAITIKEHHDGTNTAAMMERINYLIGVISAARASHDKLNFEYYSGLYDGYREALAAMGCTVIYNAELGVVGIEARGV